MSVQVKGSGTIGGLDEGLVVSGIVTSSTQINVGSNIKIGSAGVCTATSFVGSGANLTSLPAANLTGALPAISGANLTGITQTTINNNASTKFITGSGSANTLDCEANLSYNNSLVTFSSSNFLVDKGTNPTITAKETAGNKEVQLRANTTGGLLRTVGSYPLVLGVNQAEKLRIDSNGNVSLGLGGDAVPTSTAYNGGTLHIHQATSGSNGAQLKMTTAAGGSAAGDGFYIAHWGGNNETFIYNKEATNMRFGTNSAERLIIKNDGDLEITDGNLIVAPGHGIDFSDTGQGGSSSSMSNELLSDYEEGTWLSLIHI